MTSVNEQEKQDGSLLAVDQYMRWVSGCSPLSDEEIMQLVERIERGKAERGRPFPDAQVLVQAQAARERLIQGYQRLVVFLASRWVRRADKVEFLDVVQEGNLGLLHLLEHYDLRKVDSVGSMAAACIRHAMCRLIRDRHEVLRLPGNLSEAIWRMRRVEAELCVELGREPTTSEVAQQLGMSTQAVRSLVVAQEHRCVESVEALVCHGETDHQVQLSSLFPQRSLLEEQQGEQMALQLAQVLETALTAHQRQIVVWCYGLEGERLTHKQIAHRLGVSEPAVGDAQRRARQKLERALGWAYGTWRGVEMDGLYTASQAAACLGMARATFQTWVRQGKIRRYAAAGSRVGRYSQREIQALAAARQQKPVL